MRYPEFARVPLAILTAGLVLGAVCQGHSYTALALVMECAAGLFWLGLVLYVLFAIRHPQAE